MLSHFGRSSKKWKRPLFSLAQTATALESSDVEGDSPKLASIDPESLRRMRMSQEETYRSSASEPLLLEELVRGPRVGMDSACERPVFLLMRLAHIVPIFSFAAHRCFFDGNAFFFGFDIVQLWAGERRCSTFIILFLRRSPLGVSTCGTGLR